MAYMSQAKKSEIAAELKNVMPSGWKWSLAVQHHSTIVLTISAAPVDLIGEYNKHVKRQWEARGDTFTPETDRVQLNPYHLDGQFSGQLLAQFERIKSALNTGNHDNSDLMTDYFDVGWYVSINIGHRDKPFQVVAAKPQPPAPSNPPSSPVPGSPEYESLRAQVEALKKPKPVYVMPAAPPPIKHQAQSDLDHCWMMGKANC